MYAHFSFKAKFEYFKGAIYLSQTIIFYSLNIIHEYEYLHHKRTIGLQVEVRHAQFGFEKVIAKCSIQGIQGWKAYMENSPSFGIFIFLVFWPFCCF